MDLLLKWVWRLYQDKYTIWAKIIHAKYADTSDLFAGTGQGAPNSGKIFTRLNTLFKFGLSMS
jgi:hypothetical protein